MPALSTTTYPTSRVPVVTAVGAYVRLRTQPLPLLTAAQSNVAGPLQPDGIGPAAAERAKPVIGLPSLEVKVIATVRLAPTTTATAGCDGVATTRSSVPERGVLPPVSIETGAVEVMAGGAGTVPDAAPDPMELPLDVDPHPANSVAPSVPARSDRGLRSMNRPSQRS